MKRGRGRRGAKRDGNRLKGTREMGERREMGTPGSYLGKGSKRLEKK